MRDSNSIRHLNGAPTSLVGVGPLRCRPRTPHAIARCSGPTTSRRRTATSAKPHSCLSRFSSAASTTHRTSTRAPVQRPVGARAAARIHAPGQARKHQRWGEGEGDLNSSRLTSWNSSKHPARRSGSQASSSLSWSRLRSVPRAARVASRTGTSRSNRWTPTPTPRAHTPNILRPRPPSIDIARPHAGPGSQPRQRLTSLRRIGAPANR